MTFAALTLAAFYSTAAQAADVKTALVSEGELTIATTGNAPPMTMMTDVGELAGFDIALCTRIAEDLGLTPKFVRVDFAATIPGLKAGRFDMICSAVARTPARLESPDLFMSDPTIENFSTLVVPADSPIATVEAARGARIGTVRGGQEAALLEKVFGAEVQVATYPGIAEELMDLKNGRIAAVAMNFTTAAHHARYEPALKVLEQGFMVEETSPYTHGLVIARSEPDLLTAVNDRLRALTADGTVAALKAEWITGQ